MSSEQKTKSQSVLLVGNPADAFEKPENILSQPGFSCCDSMIEAVGLTTERSFDKIFVVLSSFNGNLQAALKALQQVKRNASIVLLTQMYDEPKVREMIGWGGKLRGLIDNYMICPIQPSMLKKKNLPAKPAPAAPAKSPDIRGQYESRIAELEKLATEDDLTGLKNRRYVREFLRQIITRAAKEGLQVTLLLFDIDDFKHYNDTYGHAIGDNVLRQVAVMMSRCCREQDIIARVGGDEFAVVFWDVPPKQDEQNQLESERRLSRATHPREVFTLAERFRNQVNSTELSFLGPEGKGTLTISGGLASFPADGVVVAELFDQADKAMLEAKKGGKNRIYLVGQPE